MLLELKQVFENSGVVKEFEFFLSDEIANKEEAEGFPAVTKPIFVKGSAYSKTQVACLSYKVTGAVLLSCDRCLKEVPYEIDLDITQTIVKEAQSELGYDDYIVVDGTVLDLTRLALDDVLLSLPTKSVCSEDCKGICPRCGINLNKGSCDCGKPEIDPRLAVLGQLLK